MSLRQVLILFATASVLGACAQPGARPGDAPAGSGYGVELAQAGDPENYEERARQVFGDKPVPRADLPARDLDSAFLYKFLLAEVAAQRGDYRVAAQAYFDMAKATRDPRVARRATELALFGRNNELALESARIWLATEKDSAPARQTVTALLVNSNNLQAAKPLIKEMLAADGEGVGASLMQLYGLLAKHSDRNAVLALVKELTTPYKQHPEAHFALAQAANAAGKFDQALSEIREAMRTRPDWEQAALLQSQILGKQSRAKSFDYLSGFLAANPKSQEVRLAYARQLTADKKYGEARAQFQRLLEDNPENADIAITVALLSLQMNDLDAAEQQLKRTLELNYKDPDSVRFHLGQVAEQRKQYDEAAKWYLSVEEGEQYVLANARYAFMLARQGKLDQARRHLQELQADDQAQKVQILQTEAQLLRENKAYAEAYELLKKALDAQPDHPELLYDVALAAEKLDRIDVAESSLRKLIILKPDNAQAYNALGYTLADRTDRLAEARGYIEKALKLAPEDPFILDSMGWVEYRLGNHGQGLQYLQRAFDQRPDPEIAAHLGEVLWAKGRKGEAEKVWRDSLRDNPDSEELQKVIRKFIP
jgi:tetratricopeptide (TPR) repeat protein